MRIFLAFFLFAQTGQKFRVTSAASSDMWLDSNGVRKLAILAPSNAIQGLVLPFNQAGWCDSETGYAMLLSCGVQFSATIRGFYFTP